jgi:hypothetical protein
VYKFPVTQKWENTLTLTRSFEWTEGLTAFNECSYRLLPITATKEDKQERTRLIKNCYDLLGYVTI